MEAKLYLLGIPLPTRPGGCGHAYGDGHTKGWAGVMCDTAGAMCDTLLHKALFLAGAYY